MIASARRRLLMRVLAALAVMLVGAIAGAVLGLLTAAHLEVAGSDVSIRLVPGRAYDQIDVSGALSGRRATTRSVLGEPIGVRASFDIDANSLFGPDGQFNADVLPAYLQAYSDPEQLVTDVRDALVRHVLIFAGVGAGVGLVVVLGTLGYRRWRHAYDARVDPVVLRSAHRYGRPGQTFARRVAAAVVLAAVVNAIPAAVRAEAAPRAIRPNPILAGTPLEGTEIDGLLRPVISAAESYVRTYFAETDDYYDRLRDRLRTFLSTEAPTLPTGDGVVHFGFVTDRHCNIGMDRVTVELLKHYGITTLVSGGDDDFSGSFSFESACTKNLADKTRQAGISDVFVAGNHDSAQTLADERTQKIHVLDDKVVSVHSLHFLGDPDPRSSRYGQGIEPSAEADQHRVLDAQAARIGKIACGQDRTLIVVLHDPRAGKGALDSGCGKATLALDGHTHKQAGPDRVALPDGSTGDQFVGASSGGAPNEDSIERSFASALTVGPLHHDATVNLISYDTTTGRLVDVTVFRFTAAQQVSVEQLTG